MAAAWIVAVAILGSSLIGCAALNPTPTIATVGGADEGKRIDRAPEPQRIDALSAEIRGVSSKISPDEAAACADRAVRYTALLAKANRLSSSAEFNSLMVNIGARRRGQCFQLAEDLKAELLSQNYQTLQFTRGVAWWDTMLSEHNCIVITAPGQPFEEGLVLDPWRNPGTLRWARVSRDAYPWIPRVVKQPTTAPIQTASHEPALNPPM